MVGLEVIQCLNLALVLPCLMVVSCLCEKELAIEMHLWVYGMDVRVLNRRGEYGINY